MSVVCYGGFLSYSRLGLCNSRIVGILDNGGGLRWQVLKKMDEELSKGDERAALFLVKDLQGKPGGLRCFGAARQVSFNGGFSTLILDSIGHALSQKYHNKVIQVNKGQVSATMLNRFSCIALAGVATEYLLFGCAEGGLTDIYQL